MNSYLFKVKYIEHLLYVDITVFLSLLKLERIRETWTFSTFRFKAFLARTFLSVPDRLILQPFTVHERLMNVPKRSMSFFDRLKPFHDRKCSETAMKRWGKLERSGMSNGQALWEVLFCVYFNFFLLDMSQVLYVRRVYFWNHRKYFEDSEIISWFQT